MEKRKQCDPHEELKALAAPFNDLIERLGLSRNNGAVIAYAGHLRAQAHATADLKNKCADLEFWNNQVMAQLAMYQAMERYVEARRALDGKEADDAAG